jgi:subtilisin family serine protease
LLQEDEMSRQLCSWCAVAALIALSTAVVPAQRPDTTFPMIVVFHEDAPLDMFAPMYRADDRAVNNPAAWNYLNRSVAGAVQALERRDDFRADHVYSAAIRGFSARLTAGQVADLRSDSNVAFIEHDGEMHATAQSVPWGISKIGANASSTLAGNGSGAVANVNVYVIDTGIALHADLNRVAHVSFAGGQNNDCNGHGTHVAGTVAAIDNASDVVGVAPGAPLTGVKVLGCNGSGSFSSVTKGVDWVTANRIRPAVANMSLSGGVSDALDTAVRNSVASGVFYVLAAGNSSVNACNSSPARAGAGSDNGIMTVAATDSAEAEASWSNFGSCVDIWAPGVSILSTRRGGGTTTMSGTSMASPHGAGAGALYLSNNTAASPEAVETAIKAAAVTAGTNSKDGRAVKRLHVAGF